MESASSRSSARARRVHVSIPVLLIASCVVAGCAAPRPEVAPERAIADAVALDAAITLRVEEEPLDAELVADAGDASSVLTLRAALASGLTASVELQAALARVQRALAAADEARLFSNPVLDVVLRAPTDGGRSVVEVAPSLGIAALLERPRKSSAADARLRGAVARAVTEALDVAAEIAERYAEAQALDELVQRLVERRALLAKLVDVARSRLAFGEATRVDVTTLEAQSVELDLELARRSGEREQARLALARAIGRPSDAATWTLDAWAPLPIGVESERAWIEAALAHRPEIAERRWELAALGDEEALALLTPSDGASAGLAGERDGTWSFGPAVSAPLPILDDGTARRNVVRAEIVAARHELVRVQRDVVEDVRRAHAAFAAARRELARVERELVPVQRARREQVEAIYLAGQADLTAVLLAEQDLQAAQTELVELEREAAVQRVRLERAAGGAGIARRLTTRAENAGRGEGR